MLVSSIVVVVAAEASLTDVPIAEVLGAVDAGTVGGTVVVTLEGAVVTIGAVYDG